MAASDNNNSGIEYHVDGHVARLTLNRPDTLNAIDEAMHEELMAAFEAIGGNSDVRVVVFAANGKAFSAGGDLNELEELNRDDVKRERMCGVGIRLIEALIDVPVPIVVALHGDAIGLGASVVLGCDIIVASKTARLADTHVKVGLVAGDGGCLVWPASLGMHRAKRYLLTGKMLPAEKAYEFGLVTDLVDEPDDAMTVANEIAEEIAALAPLAVSGTKRALNHLMQARSNEVFRQSMEYEMVSLASEDILEAVAAFKERRAPVYKGS